MTPNAIILVLSAYFALLFIISFFTGRHSGNKDFYIGNRQSPWYVVAFGMIGASLSGVTFISVPGWVGASQFSYLQMVLGYLIGYFVIARILLPVYYRLNLTSIYTYLDQRFGKVSYKTGASFFLFSRIIGASFRLYLVANVLQLTIFDAFKVPFALTVALTILLIWLYTFKGGIKTIVWTDTLQTLFMLLAVGFSIYFLADGLQLNFSQMVQTISESDYSRIWFFDDFKNENFFLKQIVSGAFITIVMTGLDQDMMQKNLSCKNLKDAQKNMYWYGAAFVPANLLFLSLGVLLFIFAQQHAIALPAKADDLFPLIATQGYLPPVVSVFFMLGLVAAAYSSADSALTSLTTSTAIDILDLPNKELPQKQKDRIRMAIHLGISILLGVVIVIFNVMNNDSVISTLFKFAGYTYGPLLGLYAFGLFTKHQLQDKWVWLVCILSPVFSVLLNIFSETILWGYKFGFEILLVNGFLTFAGLWVLRVRRGD